MSPSYIIAHDLGTSGTKAALVDLNGSVVAKAEKRYNVYYTADGGAEQDPNEWWNALGETTREMMAKSGVDPKNIAGMSMSAQMVGTVPVDAEGKALRRVMIWLDARADKEAEYLVGLTGSPWITGKAPSAKILWIMRHEPEIYARTSKMLDCKDYLLARMTGNYFTDVTCAIATTLMDPETGGWSTDFLGAMELPLEKLPDIVPSTQVIGQLNSQSASEFGLVPGIPIVAGGGDVPCAVIGSGAISPGRAHLYLGTSAWVFGAVDRLVMDAEGLSPGAGCDPTTFLLGGEMDNAGGCLKWFVENLVGSDEKEAAQKQGISLYQYLDQMALQTPPGAEGLLFLPWVWGERAPVNDDWVRGGFAGLGLNHKKTHMVRAILEGVGHHIHWILESFEKAGVPVPELNVIGGGATSSAWMQILADTTGVTMRQVEQPLEACARGAAMTAAVGLGCYPDFAAVEKTIKLTGAAFAPDLATSPVYAKAYAGFRSLYKPLSDIGNNRV